MTPGNRPPFTFRQVAPAVLYDVGGPETTLPALTALRAARLLLSREEERPPKERARLKRLRQADPAMGQTDQMVSAFCQRRPTRQGAGLAAWLTQATDRASPDLCAFARRLRKDQEAVQAGLTVEWSNGQVEGQMHRLQLLKRQRDGRASFPLLRQRVLRRAWSRQELKSLKGTLLSDQHLHGKTPHAWRGLP